MSSFLAIDFGERRTGVAVGETETRMVTPIATIQRSSDRQLIDALKLLATTHDATRLVLGLPCLLDGSEGDIAVRVRSFAGKVSTHCSLPFDLVSETLTSRAAHERIRSYGGPAIRSRSSKTSRTQNRSPQYQLDAVAAQIIGEQFLNQAVTS